MLNVLLICGMAEIYNPKELDRNTPLAIHLAVELAKSLGSMVKDYPIASGFIALTQLFAAGVEINQALQGNPPSFDEIKLNHVAMLTLFGVPGGMVLEGGVRLARAWGRIEKRWRDGSISSDPSLAELFDRKDPIE